MWNVDLELLEKAILDCLEKTGRYSKAIIPMVEDAGHFREVWCAFV